MADLDTKQKHSREEVMQFLLIPCLRIKERNGGMNNNSRSSAVTSLETGTGKVRRTSNTALNVVHCVLSHAI
jgi:hypothetical protein